MKKPQKKEVSEGVVHKKCLFKKNRMEYKLCPRMNMNVAAVNCTLKDNKP